MKSKLLKRRLGRPKGSKNKVKPIVKSLAQIKASAIAASAMVVPTITIPRWDLSVIISALDRLYYTAGEFRDDSLAASLDQALEALSIGKTALYKA